MGIEVIKEGNLNADGSEQTLVEFTELGKLEGYINLSNLALGDTVIVCQYQKVYGEYKQYAEETYNGVQVLPVVYITPKSGKDGVRVTIQQTTGTMRALTHCFFKEVDAVSVKVQPKGSFKV